MSNGRINGKQIIDNTVVKTINGLTFSDQYIVSNNDTNVTLTIATSGSTHSLTVGWTGTLPLSRGGTNNTSFTASQILISSTNSIISSGIKFNDSGTSSNDIWTANKIISYIQDNFGLVTKSGYVEGSTFSGIIKYYDVVFDTPFLNSNYSASIIGNSVRTWSISNQTTSGFRIESNSTEQINGNVFWICMVNGESSMSNNRGQISINLNGGLSTITTGLKTYVTSPYSGIIDGWEILSTATGSITVDIWKDTYDNYPPTVDDSICGVNKPNLSSQIKNNGSVSGWNTNILEGDIIAFNVDSVSSITQVSITLKINKI